VTVLKHQQAAALVRRQVASGALPPGAPAPSGAQLARVTGYSVLTCRRALRTLVSEGTLAAGASRNARPRVPGPDRSGQALAAASRALSTALARHRRAAGLTQPQLSRLIGLSVTTIGHAETGRTWQGRPFWEQADSALHANGELLRLHDAYRAAQATTPDSDSATGQPPPGVPITRHEADPAKPPATVTVDVAAPVNRITITWADGTTTTVRPPEPCNTPRPGTDVEETQ
jgi:DNA-binding transcriptional regulator YhcF (GntR family)